ncbi:hypothetical protein QBA54_20785 [Streptomyces sp. B21-108]|uniref:hypothetical protein n=1 Tax=Streptomyces sp. B21-108 TaxID=3039419 RepID=UPI002FF22C51
MSTYNARQSTYPRSPRRRPCISGEQWSQLLTYSTGGQRSVVKQTAIRIGNVLVLVSGAPGLVDANLEKALDKAQAAL